MLYKLKKSVYTTYKIQ